MSDKVFLVMRVSDIGGGFDYQPILAFFDKEKAEDYANKCITRAKEVNEFNANLENIIAKKMNWDRKLYSRSLDLFQRKGAMKEFMEKSKLFNEEYAKRKQINEFDPESHEQDYAVEEVPIKK